MKPRPTILLIGKSGQVGFELDRLLRGLGDVIATGLPELDLREKDSIRGVVRETRPQIIVNAAAYTAVDSAEGDEPAAQAINAEAPAILAGEGKRLGALLVHYSTDYVFDGTKRSPYLETDATHPLNVYGKTKLAGEQGIRDSGVAHLILRTSWVYSTRGKNFLLTILRKATEREELRVIADQVGAPICAHDLAAATLRILSGIWRQDPAEFQRSLDSVCGTYHITAAGETTWYGFAQAILERAPAILPNTPWFAAATRGRPLIAKRIVPITTAEFASSTHRPAYSVLSNLRLSQTFHLTLPDWPTQLQHCLGLAGENPTEKPQVTSANPS